MPNRPGPRTPILAFLLCGATALVIPASAQELPEPRLPQPPADGCRSEIDARLAFGLCPDSTFDFYATGPYAPGVPTPQEVLGYPIGSWHTTYGRMERYLAALAAASPERVRVFDYGQSIERQTLHLVAVSSERNIRNLEQIRNDLQTLADPRATSVQQARDLAVRLPVVVWLNAANDGNETAAFEAAIQVAYQLAAGEDAETQRLRDGAVTLINLAHNPESHERFVAWYNAFVMGDADPAALEHRAPWGMSTNNNHYQFDLNRDALGLTQTESRAVAAELQRWRPQVFVDLHGQTTQYFFPPAAPPVNPVYPPQMEKWLDVFGRANAAAFDRFGWSYYTRDVFDLYYPGYWDTYPALHGATGMTYETDGGGSKGVRWRRDDGTILTFADGIAHHFVASLATIGAAVTNREQRLADYYDWFAGALAEARQDPLRSVVLLPGNDPRRAARLATTLLRHGIEVSRATSQGTLTGTDYLTGARTRREVPAGAYVVDLLQPNYRLAKALLAPDVELPEGFARQELARLARNLRRAPEHREGFEFYDVTAWSLPLAGGVEAFWTGDVANVERRALVLPDGAAKSPGGWHGEVAWELPGGVSARARSAYLWRGGTAGGVRLAARLMGEGFVVAVAERPLLAAADSFPAGSFLARVGRNPDALHLRIDALAREAGVVVHAAQTAFPERGPTGTGSESVRSLKLPRVAVLAGEGVRIGAYGALWFELERRIGLPFTALRAERLDDVALDRFDVLVVPDGSYGALGDAGAEQLKEWVERGGTLVAYGGGARWVQGREEFELEWLEPDTTALADEERQALREAIQRAAGSELELPPVESPSAQSEMRLEVPGTFLRGRLDRTHWLTFGYARDELPLLARSLPLMPTRGGVNAVAYTEGDDLVIGGFAWPQLARRTYAGGAYATVDELGDGRVILFAEDPLYRGVFDAPSGLLWNALLLGGRGRGGAE